MSEELIRSWSERAARAVTWRPGEDPAPVLEALAHSVALELTGALSRAPATERDRLRKVGQRALLQIGGGDLDEDELDALRRCAALARDGLRALSGRPPPGSSSDAGRADDARVLIPAGDLTRLARGQLDGFAAASLALRIRRSATATAELRALLDLASPAPRTLALAAAEAAPVLDPAAGRLVGTLEALGAEAVLFEGSPRRLAVYAEDPEPLRLVAPELTTEDVREGYWIGRVCEGAEQIEAKLHAADRVEAWTIELPAPD